MLQTNLFNPGHADLVTRELDLPRFGQRRADHSDVVYDFYGERRELAVSRYLN